MTKDNSYQPSKAELDEPVKIDAAPEELARAVVAVGTGDRVKHLKATHSGDLKIGNSSIPCAVLEDGTRVLTENGITNALLGSRSGYSKRRARASKAEGAPLPLFLAPASLQPFIPNDLADGPLVPLMYRQNSRLVRGYDAAVLPKICDVWLRARDADALQEQQRDKAKKADLLMRGLAQVGIIALVDEATGYQEVRDRQALQAILDKYLLKEHAKWSKRFPDDFYKEIFRLRSWEWRGMKVNRPQVVGHYTNDLVWDRIAPGVRTDLERINPKKETGSRRVKHHQWLTHDVGHPELQKHLVGVIALMKSVQTDHGWDECIRRIQRVYPKVGENLSVLPDE